MVAEERPQLDLNQRQGGSELQQQWSGLEGALDESERVQLGETGEGGVELTHLLGRKPVSGPEAELESERSQAGAQTG